MRLRRAGLKIEALWWLSRFYLNHQPLWMVLMGWFAARPAPDAGRLASLIVFVVAIGSAMMMLNDILDAEKDAVTAPFLPIPQGLISARAASFVTGGLVAGAFVALYLAAGDWARFLYCAALFLLTVLGIGAYSKLKETGLLGSILLISVGLPFTVLPIVGWIVGRGTNGWAIAAIALYGCIAGMSTNTLAHLRDVDLDAKAGNHTIAVRVGAVAAYRLAVALALAGAAVAAALALTTQGGWRGLVVLGPSVATLAWAYPRALPTFREPGRGRWQRIADMRATKLAELLRHASVVAVYTLPTALALAVGLELLLFLGTRLYGKRVVEGGIRRSLALVVGGSPRQS